MCFFSCFWTGKNQPSKVWWTPADSPCWRVPERCSAGGRNRTGWTRTQQREADPKGDPTSDPTQWANVVESQRAIVQFVGHVTVKWDKLQVFHTLHSSDFHGLLTASQRGSGGIRSDQIAVWSSWSFPSVQTPILLLRTALAADYRRVCGEIWSIVSTQASLHPLLLPATHFLLPNHG